MKKLCLLAVVMFIGLTNVFAQKGAKSIGANIGYSSEIQALKLGVNFKYHFSNQFRVVPSFDYSFKKYNTSYWNVNVDANYLYGIGDGIDAYSLSGLTLLGIKDGSYSDTEFGANIGGGVDFYLTDALDLNVEAKYQILNNWSQLVASIGLSFRF